MSLMPGATLQLLPENETQGAIEPTQLILHTAVDAPGPTRLAHYFARTDVTVESHFWIPLDGEIIQMMDTNVRADANYHANGRAISIETEDEGDPEGIPWTDAQIDSIIVIILWANEEHDIPLVKCATDTSPGLGYHAMWGAPSEWTPARGKTCPGSTRIAQFNDTILPRLQIENIMNEDQAKNFVEKLYGILSHRKSDAGGFAFWVETFTGMSKVDALIAYIEGGAEEVNDLQDRIKALEAAATDVRHPVNNVIAVDVDINMVVDEVAEIIIGRLSNGSTSNA